MVFPVVRYGCESWTIKKAECWRIDAFEVWCWRRLLRVPWTARISNQSILKKISPENWLKGLVLKLKLQYLDHLMQNTDSLEKALMPGKIEGRRRRGWQRMRRLDGITDSMDKSLSKLRSWWWTGKPGMLQSMGLQRVGHDCNWTELKSLYQFFFSPELSLCHPNFFSLSLVFLYVNNIIIGLNTGVSMGIDHDSRYCPTTWLLHWNWSWCLWSWCFNWNWSLILCLLVVFRLDLLSNYSH